MAKEMNEDKKLTFISINELIDKEFVVPDYQRGYRWQPKQVEQLLNDLWDFAYQHRFKLNDEESPYCLQPIVVAQREDKMWEVIDGQQRLTTISLILDYLNVNGNYDNYQITYDTRNEASNKLDEYCRKEANNTIIKWFENGKGNYKRNDLTRKFYDILLEPEYYLCHFIWYNVTDEVKQNELLAIDIFDRLNIGKIGLTNAELIKALFMTFIDRYTQSAHHKQLTQISLGNEWDTMEKTLQQPLFWQFICQKPYNYVTHIEYLFDILMCKTDDQEEKYTFNKYIHLLNDNNHSVETLWEEVKGLFQQFDDWYNDPETFHYVGYLIAVGQSIEDILKWRFEINKDTKKETPLQKDAFKQLLLEKCKSTVKNLDLDDDDFFNYDKNTIRKVLLLFNVLTITQSVDKKQYFMRFPFDEYREKDEKGKCKWDIEHIHSQSDKTIDETWIQSMLTYFTGETTFPLSTQAIDNLQNEEEKNYCTILNNLLQRKWKKENVDTELQNIYVTLKAKYESDAKFEDTHSLGNLTLLDKWTNRSYQNAFFPVKRSIIIDNAKKGRFVPICTQNVFLKAYTKHLGALTEWNHLDCIDYLNEIKKTIK